MNKQVTSFLVAIATVSATCLLATNSVQGADVLSPSQMKAQLTSQDIKEATPTAPKKAGTDDIGMPIDSTKSVVRVEPRAGYPNVNSYILQNNYQHPNITKELHQFEMFGYKTNDGLPSGVAVHYTANPNSFTAREGADFEINGGWESAFVHTFIDAQNILNIHDTDYGAWGSGQYGNKYFVQFEMVTARNFADFAKTTSYSAWYTAYLLHQYNLTPSLAQAHNGIGTVWSHSDITHYLGGTDHTDPDAYFAMYGYNMQQFFSLVQHYYGQMNETVTQRQNVSLKGHVNKKQPMYWLLDNGLVKTGRITDELSNQSVEIKQWIKTSSNKEYYLATVNGKTVAWIPTSAFGVDETVVASKKVNLTGHANGGQSMYWLLDTGMKSSGHQTNELAGKKVTVKQWIKTSSNKEYYLATVNGKTVAWIPTSAFGVDETVVASKKVNLTGHANGGQSMYWLLDTGMKSSGHQTNELAGKKVTVKQWIKTSSNKEYYLATVNGKTVAWIPTSAFGVDETVVASKKVNLTGHANGGQSMYWLLDTGMKSSGHQTNELVGKKVTVKQWIKTSSNKEYYLATVNGKTVAWIPTSAFDVDETVVARKKVNLTVQVQGNQSMYWLLDTGMKASGHNTNELVNKKVVIRQWVKTSTNKEYYLTTFNGKDIAWVLKSTVY